MAIISGLICSDCDKTFSGYHNAGRCSECSAAHKKLKAREYYLAHREEALAAAKRVYEADPVGINARKKAARLAWDDNKIALETEKKRQRYAERVHYHRARNAEWREKNRDYHRAQARAWAAKNPERVRQNGIARRLRADPEARAAILREWHKSNPDKVRAARLRRKAALASVLTIGFTAEELATRMAYFGNKCWMCSGPFEHVDHVKPLSKNGPHCLSNLRPACASCNISKKDRWFGVAELHRFIRI